jgi:hypothetical protein
MIGVCALICCAGRNDEGAPENPAVTVHNQEEDEKHDEQGADESAIDYASIMGQWSLVYGGNYGYYFRFQKNYKTVVVLYLGNEALVFRGVHVIDAGAITINIYEMKREKVLSMVHSSRGFQKANSSVFVFKGSLLRKNNRSVLKLRPVKIRIDGNDSDGYFEPLIKLNYSG